MDAAAKAINDAISALTNAYKFTTEFGTFTGSGSLTGKIDAPYAKFARLIINGKEVNSANYTVTEGSTVITLKEAYLKTLSNGKYTVTAEFTDGTSTTTGDNSIFWQWLTLLGMSGLGIVGISLTRKRKLPARNGK